MTRFVVAIPARFAASRLPGKPLRLIGGEPLVLHVARRALDAGADQVWVAADDERIARLSLIDEHGERYVRMAHLACVGSHAINGVEIAYELWVVPLIEDDVAELGG